MIRAASLAGCCWLLLQALHPCTAMFMWMANACSTGSTPCPPQPVCTCALHVPASCALTWHLQLHAPSDAVAPARRTQGSPRHWALATKHDSWLAGWQWLLKGDRPEGWQVYHATALSQVSRLEHVDRTVLSYICGTAVYTCVPQWQQLWLLLAA